MDNGRREGQRWVFGKFLRIALAFRWLPTRRWNYNKRWLLDVNQAVFHPAILTEYDSFNPGLPQPLRLVVRQDRGERAGADLLLGLDPELGGQ